MAESEYLLTNARSETAARFDGLAATFDALTIEHLLRVGVAPGWRCLEILDDADTLIGSPVLMTTWGRRPT